MKSKGNPPVVLDSFALVALFHREPGWETVHQKLSELQKTGSRALLNRINWGEFYYIVKRRVGRSKAQEALDLLEDLPIEIVSVDDSLVREAAEIKSDYPLAYADAFCVATALRFGGVILTQDADFLCVEPMVSVGWLTRSRPRKGGARKRERP